MQLNVLAAQLGAPPFVLVLVDNGRNGDLRGGPRAANERRSRGGTLESAAWV
ncbi:hypothetical protein [Dermacoccus sp. GAS27A]|uniref:hypothetical protein n=1 Tax=Dermacoccus sp. GAS27A TaxID=3156270 RepID=UPI0038345F7F